MQVCVCEKEGKREHLCEETLLKGRKHLGNWEDCAQSSVLYRYKYRGICAERRGYHKRS